jgi:hypothetical protein
MRLTCHRTYLSTEDYQSSTITALATGKRMVDMKYVGVSHGVFVNGTHVIARAPSKRYILIYSGSRRLFAATFSSN